MINPQLELDANGESVPDLAFLCLLFYLGDE
jgi:hypothetical protein